MFSLSAGDVNESGQHQRTLTSDLVLCARRARLAGLSHNFRQWQTVYFVLFKSVTEMSPLLNRVQILLLLHMRARFQLTKPFSKRNQVSEMI